MGRGGIVLAGGRGVRLGLGVPKARALIGGVTLLDRAVATLGTLCDDVVVVAPEGLDLGSVPARRHPDVAGRAGPLAGLVAGLEALEGSACAVLGVDFPCVEAGLIAVLFARLDRAVEHGACHAVVPRPHGVPQPLVAVYAASAAAPLRRVLEDGISSVRDALAPLPVVWIDDADLSGLPGGLASLLNVNTPDDLVRARRRIEERVA